VKHSYLAATEHFLVRPWPIGGPVWPNILNMPRVSPAGCLCAQRPIKTQLQQDLYVVYCTYVIWHCKLIFFSVEKRSQLLSNLIETRQPPGAYWSQLLESRWRLCAAAVFRRVFQ